MAIRSVVPLSSTGFLGLAKMWLTQMIKTRGKILHIIRFSVQETFRNFMLAIQAPNDSCRLWCENKFLYKIPWKALCCLVTQPTTFSILCSKRKGVLTLTNRERSLVKCSKWNQNSRKVKRGNFNLATIISLKTLVLPEAYFALHKPSFSKSRPFLVVNNSDLDTWLSLSFCSFCAINSVRMIFKWSYAFFSFFAESSFDSASWYN